MTCFKTYSISQTILSTAYYTNFITKHRGKTINMPTSIQILIYFEDERTFLSNRVQSPAQDKQISHRSSPTPCPNILCMRKGLRFGVGWPFPQQTRINPRPRRPYDGFVFAHDSPFVAHVLSGSQLREYQELLLVVEEFDVPKCLLLSVFVLV